MFPLSVESVVAPEFRAFPKIPRMFTTVTVTEKIDGTNGCVVISDDGVFAQSRNRQLTPGKLTDNAGFAAWVERYAEDLRSLGNGYHFGEWWGEGIQGNPYNVDVKTFSLFNPRVDILPECCTVVPTLFEGEYSFDAVSDAMSDLLAWGSQAAPGAKYVEGVMVFHHAARQYFKAPFNTLPKAMHLAAA